jgi:hypothetical protein
MVAQEIQGTRLTESEALAAIRDVLARARSVFEVPDQIRVILARAESGAVPPQDGYCVCDDGHPARDCGIRAHREAAGAVPPHNIDREAVLEAISECAPHNVELQPTGMEDPLTAAYVDGVRDAYHAAEAALMRPENATRPQAPPKGES